MKAPVINLASFVGKFLSRALLPTLLVFVSAAAYTWALPGPGKNNRASQDSVTAGTDTLVSKSGLKTIVLKVGKGKRAGKGKTVFVHYVGKLADGSVFDESDRRGRPFVFKLGAGEVIKGWDEGIEGMKVGGKVLLIIPAELGYGPKGYGPIPENATLYFEVELIDVR